MDESYLITEFMKISKCDHRADAISCLHAWDWNIQKALIDYNDTSTQNYFKAKTRSVPEVVELRHTIKHSMDHFLTSATAAVANSTSDKDTFCENRFTEPKTSNYRPLLTKTDSISDSEYKKLSRGISRANDENVSLVTKARKEFAMDFHNKQQEHNHHATPFVDAPDYTFTLPDLSLHDIDFRKFLEKDLIECSTLSSLENSQRLNWWVDLKICRKLWPLSTSGDGNCLLHAASLAKWGFHDRRLTLRKALYNILSQGEDCRSALWRRWRFQQTRINREAGLVFSEEEWTREWNEIVALASAEPRNNKNNAARRRSVILDRQISCADSIDGNATYDSLEEIHVLALAYVLRRTIIVISDVVLRDINGEALAPIKFGGVYLPLDIAPDECHRVPLLLAYDTGHFSALVTMENEQSDYPPALIPLIDFENILLPIQFCIDPGVDFDWSSYDGREGQWALTEVEHIALLKEYLEVSYASPAGSPEDEIYEEYQSDEDYDKKMLDMAINLNNEENNLVSSGSPENDGKQQKSKSAKLQSVAKQFGSIGKSMSKKIKKNIGSITKLGKKYQHAASTTPSLGGAYLNGKYRLLCAQLKAKRHDYQEEMIRNYLDCAYERYIQHLRKTVANDDKNGMVRCINSDCDNFGTEQTSYMCLSCFEKQKQRETSQVNEDYNFLPPRYGTGNSKFYTQSDAKSHNVIKRLPSVKRLNELDQTLYLSKSTFFNDTKPSTSGAQRSPPSPPKYDSTASYATKGKVTIIPIRIDGQKDDLIKFDYATTPLLNQVSAKSTPNIDNVQYRNRNTNSDVTNNCLTRCVVSLPPKSPQLSVKTVVNGHQAVTNNGAFCNAMPEEIEIPPLRNSYDVSKCRTGGCSFFGSSASNFYCSKCCQEQQTQIHQQYRKLQTEI